MLCYSVAMNESAEGPTRRTVVKAAAWSVPALAVAIAAPSAAASAASITTTFICPSITPGTPYDTVSGGSVVYTAVGAVGPTDLTILWLPSDSVDPSLIATPPGAVRGLTGANLQSFSVASFADGQSVVIELPFRAPTDVWGAKAQIGTSPFTNTTEVLSSTGTAQTIFGPVPVGLC
jgi:hypothetical protein